MTTALKQHKNYAHFLLHRKSQLARRINTEGGQRKRVTVHDVDAANGHDIKAPEPTVQAAAAAAAAAVVTKTPAAANASATAISATA